MLGVDPRHDAPRVRRLVGSQLQNSALPDRLRVWEALRLFSVLSPDGPPWQTLLDQWGLASRRNTAFGELSGGQRQRLFVALALVAGAVLLTALSAIAYGGGLPHDWPGVLAGFLLATVAFAALGTFIGVVLPTARAAQGLGVLLFFVFLMLGGAVLHGPWFDQAWDGGAVAVMNGLLVVSLSLTWWRLRALEP